jgi:UPF0716 protein FxsA
MLRFALGLFLIGLPLSELALLIKTGQLIGFWATLGLVIASGAIGAMILSRQSLAVLRGVLEAAQADRPPVAAALDGALLLLAGVLLLIPGFISDGLAALLLIPPLRRAVARWSIRGLARQVHMGAGANSGATPGSTSPLRTGGGGGPIIEGEFERLSEKTVEPNPEREDKRQ